MRERMAGPAPGMGRNMSPTLASAAALPVRVSLAYESELVTRGLTSMLAGDGARVQVIASYVGGAPARDVDITLHDCLAAACFRTADPFRWSGSHAGDWVLWTWNPPPGLVELALAHGARGCLAKSLAAGELIAALEAVHRGEVVVDRGAVRVRRATDTLATLTPREVQVVSLITQGHDNSSIASETCVSINSIKSYIRTAYQKMGVSSRSQAVLWGVRHGLLDDQAPAAWRSPRELTG